MSKIMLESHHQHSDKTVILKQTYMRPSPCQLVHQRFFHLNPHIASNHADPLVETITQTLYPLVVATIAA
jgi:hypothetical protein